MAGIEFKAMLNSVFVLMVALCLTGCATMQDTRTPENKITLQLNEDYQAAYRIILNSMLYECMYSPGLIKSNLYPDINSASITVADDGFIFSMMDIRKSDSGGSDVDYYSSFTREKMKATVLQKNINEKKSGCIFNG